MGYIQKVKLKTRFGFDGEMKNSIFEIRKYNDIHYFFNYNKKMYNRLLKFQKLGQENELTKEYLDIIKFLIDNNEYLDNVGAYSKYLAGLDRNSYLNI